MAEIGKMLIIFGLIMVLFGIILIAGTKLGSIPLGRLPGDIIVKRDNFTFYFPLTTSILLSVLLSLLLFIILNLVKR